MRHLVALLVSYLLVLQHVGASLQQQEVDIHQYLKEGYVVSLLPRIDPSSFFIDEKEKHVYPSFTLFPLPILSPYASFISFQFIYFISSYVLYCYLNYKICEGRECGEAREEP